MNSCFFILFWLNVYFSLLVHIIEYRFPPLNVVPLMCFCISLGIACTTSFICRSPQSFLWAPWLPVFWTLHLIGWLSLQCLVHLFLIFIFREWVGREKESKTNINVCLPVACPILGTWMANQAHALTGNWTASLWFTGWHFTHWLKADRHLCCNVELLFHLGHISLSHCTA